MNIRNFIVLAGILTSTALMAPSSARAANGDDRAKKLQLGMAGGFMFGPRGPNLGADLNYYVTNNISLAPQFSYTSYKDADLFIMSVEGRYTLDFKGSEIENSLKPWVGAGVGAVIANPTGKGNDKGSDFQMSAGFDYYFSRQFSLGTNATAIFPFAIYHESFLFRWQVLEAKVLF